MKAKLAEAMQEAPSAEVVEPEVLQRYFAKFDEAFFTFCEKGLYYLLSNLICLNVEIRKLMLHRIDQN